MKVPPGPEDNLLSAAFLEGMLAEFAQDPNAVPSDWRDYLSSNGHGGGEGGGGVVRLAPRFAPPPAAWREDGTDVEQSDQRHRPAPRLSGTAPRLPSLP